MFDTILLATDGSDIATNAVEEGFKIAREFGATVHVLSVEPELDQPNSDETGERASEAAQKIVRTAIQKGFSSELQIISAVRSGRPHREILAYSEQHDVDLVVLGTRGRTGLRKFLLGSVATSVIREARRPVLTVGNAASNSSSEYRDVLIPTNGLPGSAAAIDHGIAIAARYAACVHTIYVIDNTISRSPAYIELLREFGQQATNDVAIRAATSGVRHDWEIAQGDPADEILAYIENRGIDLVVIGTERRTELERIALGSVAERVIAAASVPVLTVRTVTRE